jgi:hypothetical protein
MRPHKRSDPLPNVRARRYIEAVAVAPRREAGTGSLPDRSAAGLMTAPQMGALNGPPDTCDEFNLGRKLHA